MSSYSKSVLSYRDVHLAFEQAGHLGSLTLNFETPSKAVTWAGRANAYRVLLRKQNEEAGREFACEFDHLMVRRKNGENFVRIEPRGFDFKAVGPDGRVIDLDKRTLDSAVPTPYQRTLAARDIDSFLDSFSEVPEEKK